MASMLPDSSIDFTRPYSLPIGLPPHSVSLDDLSKYISEIGVRLEFLELMWASADPYMSTEHPRDPLTGTLRVRFIRNVGIAGAVTIPTTLNSACIADGNKGTLSFRSATLNPITTGWTSPRENAGRRKPWTAVMPKPGETINAAMARTFRWDDDERTLWALPQPYLADESLCLYWPTSAMPTDPLGVDIPGIFADETSSHLLATTAAA